MGRRSLQQVESTGSKGESHRSRSRSHTSTCIMGGRKSSLYGDDDGKEMKGKTTTTTTIWCPNSSSSPPRQQEYDKETKKVIKEEKKKKKDKRENKNKKEKAEKKKLKKRKRVEMAEIYSQELGTEGVKEDTKKYYTATATTTCNDFDVPLTTDEEKRRERRKARFTVHTSSAHDDDKQPLPSKTCESPSSTTTTTPHEYDTDEGEDYYNYTHDDEKSLEQLKGHRRNVGTSTALEKPYLRLTTNPIMETVRPLRILMRSLVHVKNQFVRTEDFEWANEQLKSIRQDITVQQLRCNFVLDVYETHARLLLEYGDLPGFHQCQTMIRTLTSSTSSYPNEDMELFGKDEEEVEKQQRKRQQVGKEDDGSSLSCRSQEATSIVLKQSEEGQDEFCAYEILYNLIQNSSLGILTALSRAKRLESSDSTSTTTSKSRNRSRRTETTSRVRPACVRGTSCRHAYHVLQSILHFDHLTFFRLYESAPHMSAYLMDFLVRRVRQNAYQRTIASYRPTLSVEYFRKILHFHDLDETRRFLYQTDAVFLRELDHHGQPFWIDCKSTFVLFASNQNKTKH